MYSFYGGKEGRTYNLVAHYDSIYDMVKAFQQGASNTDAKYNEYVIIDTIINKNKKHNRENGIIYRRGVNYTQDFDPNKILGNGDASHSLTEDDLTVSSVTLRGNNGEWIDDEHIPETAPLEKSILVPRYRHYEYCLTQVPGQDVQVELHTKELKVNEKGETLFNIDWKNFVTEPGGGAVYVGQIVGPQGESPLTQLVDWDVFEEQYLHNVENTEPVKGELLAIRRPGFDGSNYNDDIKYGYCNVRDDQDNVTGVILSMDMPYIVFKFESESGSAYGPITRDVPTYQDLPSKTDVDKNVYYHDLEKDEYYIWDDTRKIETIVNTVENEAALPAPAAVNEQQLYYRLDNEKYYRGIVSYSWDEEEQRDMFTVTWEETTYTSYITAPGYVLTELWIVETPEDNPATWKYTNLLREYADSQGHNFYKHYNITVPKGVHGTDFAGFNDVDSDNEYALVYRWKVYNDPETKEDGHEYSASVGTLKVIKDTEMLSTDITTGDLISFIKINYFTKDTQGNYEHDDIPIRRIDRVTLDGQGGVAVTYVEGNNTIRENLNSGSPLQWITKVELVPDTKQVKVTYNTINRDTGEQNTWTSTEQLKIVDEIGIENDRDLAGRKTFYYKYNVGEVGAADNPHIPMGELALNEIVETKLVGDNIAVLYSDSALRAEVYASGNYYELPYTGGLWNASTPDVRKSNTDYFYWANLGPSLSGEHIFGQFTSIEALRQAYPNGFGTDTISDGREGWIATVTTGTAPNITTSLYAFDYITTHDWYVVSSITQNQVEPSSVIIVDNPSTSVDHIPATSAKDSTLLNNGYWFVTYNTSIAEEL